jgi:hypothetical protein
LRFPCLSSVFISQVSTARRSFRAYCASCALSFSQLLLRIVTLVYTFERFDRILLSFTPCTMSSSSSSSLIQLLPLLLSLVVATTAKSEKCYFPNGKVATTYDWVPCEIPPSTTTYTSSNHSACCYPKEGDKCLPSGLCDWPGNYVYRGACTDRTWQDPSCGLFCPGQGKDDWLQLRQCTSTQWCCPAGDSNCCTDGSALFSVNGTSPAASAAAASDAVGPTSTGTNAGRGNGTDAGGAGAGAGGDGKVKPLTTGIIAGVVCAAIVFLVAGIVLCIWMRRKKRREAGEKPDGLGLTSHHHHHQHQHQSPFEEHQMADQSRPTTSYTTHSHHTGYATHAQHPIPPPPPPPSNFSSPPPTYQYPVSPYTTQSQSPNPFSDDYKKPGTPASATGTPTGAYYAPPPPPPPQQGYAHVPEPRPVYGRPAVFEMAG